MNEPCIQEESEERSREKKPVAQQHGERQLFPNYPMDTSPLSP